MKHSKHDIWVSRGLVVLFLLCLTIVGFPSSSSATSGDSKPLTVYVVNYPLKYFAQRLHWEPDEVPTGEQIVELRNILRDHPAKWIIWEGEPNPASVAKLRAMGMNSLVFDPCGNVADEGDFLSVMRQNVDNLKKAFL